jgi:hypothetical protein
MMLVAGSAAARRSFWFIDKEVFGHRMIVEVRTFESGAVRVDTPLQAFVSIASLDRATIDLVEQLQAAESRLGNEEFGRLIATGHAVEVTEQIDEP